MQHGYLRRNIGKTSAQDHRLALSAVFINIELKLLVDCSHGGQFFLPFGGGGSIAAAAVGRTCAGHNSFLFFGVALNIIKHNSFLSHISVSSSYVIQPETCCPVLLLSSL